MDITESFAAKGKVSSGLSISEPITNNTLFHALPEARRTDWITVLVLSSTSITALEFDPGNASSPAIPMSAK